MLELARELIFEFAAERRLAATASTRRITGLDHEVADDPVELPQADGASAQAFIIVLMQCSQAGHTVRVPLLDALFPQHNTILTDVGNTHYCPVVVAALRELREVLNGLGRMFVVQFDRYRTHRRIYLNLGGFHVESGGILS